MFATYKVEFVSLNIKRRKQIRLASVIGFYSKTLKVYVN